MLKDTKDRTEAIVRGVKYRAGKRFAEGRYENPYGDPQVAYFESNDIKSGMAEVFQREMEDLLKSKVCPCCGQFTQQDFDW